MPCTTQTRHAWRIVLLLALASKVCPSRCRWSGRPPVSPSTALLRYAKKKLTTCISNHGSVTSLCRTGHHFIQRR
ncbi:hypothetical protein PF002_g4137 [Phytophthora fragariae]|uniref:Secreted protein n=1 Tax=Phytophthora fragariae TaxID=53985 RepID=A0A6A4ELT0_9STRA|nr:hypothetical protein PF007_g3574 [Phytophthora fragariae]KAE9251809.1 hypothetical protein PF002_g4137 [Phytophthora fragariae]KAE9324907.1 hypothetical protein PF001_g3210 [Phytophthora fragariae]